MNYEERNKNLEKLLTEMNEILLKKGHDYSDTDDALSNFKLSELMNMKSYEGVLVRISDKFSRLCEFSKKKEFKVNDESFKDTCIDLANYSLLCYLCYKDEKDKESTKILGG